MPRAACEDVREARLRGRLRPGELLPAGLRLFWYRDVTPCNAGSMLLCYDV